MSRSTQLRLTIDHPANERASEGSIREIVGALLKPVTVLGGQMRWRSLLLSGILSQATLSLSTRQKIAELFKDPVLAEVVRNHPRLPRKYLAHQYLIRGLPISVRAACLFHHYERLRSILPVWLLRQTLVLRHRRRTGLESGDGRPGYLCHRVFDCSWMGCKFDRQGYSPDRAHSGR